jgi:ABC-type branched-subunit amino acid transport system ATPase component
MTSAAPSRMDGSADPVPAPGALRAERVAMSFSGLRALVDVDLEVPPATIVGLIGPNGSGKTTLLNVLSGVLAPSAGRVVVGPHDVTGWPAHRMAALGVARTFQNIRLFGHMTVLENVEVGAALHAGGQRGAALRRNARALLAETDLASVAERRAATLPYGLQRRVEIARALATRPTYLLLDEPAAGTNEAESDELRDLIEELRRRHELGLLVVEHDLRLIMRLADRIVVLNEGRRISVGTAEEVSNDPVVREAYFGRRAAGADAGHPAGAPEGIG